MNSLLQQLLPKYTIILENEETNSEVYKWEAIEHFQKNWDINTSDFYGMFKRSFAKRSNLMFQNSFGFLNTLSKEMPEESKKLFEILFDDETPLEKRIAEYQNMAIRLLPEVIVKSGKSKLNHQQDERTISFLLTLHNPEKYYLYKDNVYQWLCELKQVNPKEAGQKYFHFCELAEDDLEFIQQKDEIKKLTRKFIPENFQFDSTKLIFQDILFRTMPRTDQIRKTYFEQLTDEVKSYLEAVNHPLVEHVWRDITKNYRWISIWKDEQVDPYFLHYEITLEKDQLTVELHPEGSEAFKIAFEPFLQHVNKSIHTTKTWHFGLADKKKGNYHKIVSKAICAPYNNEIEPTNEQIQAVAERLIEYYDNYQAKIISFLTEIDFFNSEQPQNTMTKPALNEILYGPPGTGKTYSTTLHALSIVEEKPLEILKREKYEDILLRYSEYKEKKIIDFVTFHQSYSYEDFIEGIKPALTSVADNTETLVDDDLSNNSISYNIEDGVFKDMCSNANSYEEFGDNQTDEYYLDPALLNDKGFHKISLGNTQGESGEIIYNYCKENSCIAIGWGGDDVDYTGVKDRKEIKRRFEEAGYDSKNVFNINAIERLALWIKRGDIIFVSHGNKILKAVGVVEGDYEHKPNSSLPFSGYNHFRKVKWLITDAHIPVHEVYYANFSQQSIYALWSNKVKKEFFTSRAIASNRPKNHVLIIDEINRGNVSAIFGELITLIEEDKRKGKNNQLSLTLPYSKKPFTVPSNLYIIGTMNTADRSVEALDTALRRRFSFVEMLPDPKELKNKGTHGDGMIEDINLEELLTKLNDRIEVLVDRDHTIGHAFFINDKSINDLKHTFKNKIIPLLQEYFYGNYQKMALVLGNSFFSIKEQKSVKFAEEAKDYDFSDQVYTIRDCTDNNFDFLNAIRKLMNKPVKEDHQQEEKVNQELESEVTEQNNG